MGRRDHFDDGAISDRPDAVVFDMDGTLADVSSIRHYVSGENRDFHRFHEESVNVPANEDVVDMARKASDEGKKVIVVTARRAKYRPHTAMWLAQHQVPSDAMYMRSSTDSRPDREVKEDIYRRMSRSFNVVHAVDDNPSILDLWQQHGISTTAVDSGLTDKRYQPKTPPR